VDLLQLGTARRYEDGERILRQGDTEQFVVLLQNGQAKVVATTAGGRSFLLGIRFPGDLVGELSLLDGGPRSASVIAFGPVVGSTITGSAFIEFLDRHPRATREVMRMIGERLRSADRRRVELGYDVSTRVICVLAEFVATSDTQLSRHAVEVRLTQRELAELVGAAEVTVQKALRGLSRAGVVSTSYGRILVRRPHLLAAEVRQLTQSHRST
jgi:CRP-like cAMP-binding protein